MARIGESGELLKCSFCGLSQKQVQKLIAGPGVYICNECVKLCCEICADEGLAFAEEYKATFDRGIPLSTWIDSAERAETIKLVTEARKTLEQLLKLLDLQHSSKDS